MQVRSRNTFLTIRSEGALLPIDLLQRILENDSSLEGLNAESYHLAPGEKINEAINRSWSRMNGLWGPFKAARQRLGEKDPATTLTRERWLMPLFQELGFGQLSPAKAVQIEGKSYPISHRWRNVPIHLVGCRLDLDQRARGVAGAARISPHSLLQEYLNRSDESQWGILSNGLQLRLLRDNASLTRQSYLEFDLESMFDGEIYSDFVLLWLLAHQSRFESGDQGTTCLLERWSQSAQERGTRALEELRRGVEEAIVLLGQGFLQHPLNGRLRERLKGGDLAAQDYYRQLLRLVYRLIFLFTAEDRDLLLLPDAPTEAKERYLRYYSTANLRALAQRQRGSRHHDRYEALKVVMKLLGGEQPLMREDRQQVPGGYLPLALPVLGGFLFDPDSIPDLNDAHLDNHSLLSAVRSLAFITEKNTRRAVDFRNLGTEELGSVYESLLELHPSFNIEAGAFQLASAAGNERRSTGSYYTPSSLIQVLLDSALEPIIEDRLKGKPGVEQEQALLDLRVCDPACGSGHFLIAAAHRIAWRLAQIRCGGDEPPPTETRRALRDVIRHCVYGVDINPMAVELCKVNLWLESLEQGKPLSFLDAHIKCGNSLVGVGPGRLLEELEIPDEAFNAVSGDDQTTAKRLMRRNRDERRGQEEFFTVTLITSKEELAQYFAKQIRIVEAMPEDDATQVQAKAESYRQLSESAAYQRQRQIADLWTAAFFWKIDPPQGGSVEIIAPTYGQLRRLREGREVQKGLLEQVERLRSAERFFHWQLEFPEVFHPSPSGRGAGGEGGFDVVLGNPPWERIKLQEQEFFASRDDRIATAPNAAARKRLIAGLPEENPTLWEEYRRALHTAESISRFLRAAGNYPLTGRGDINTYSVFAERMRALLAPEGRAGVILPTGIATDDTNKFFFADVVERGQLASLFDFENREKLFPAVDSRMKFCLLTLSGSPASRLPSPVSLSFFATRAEHLRDPRRVFTLTREDIVRINPNTHTLPVFRTRQDADLSRAIYQRVPVLDPHPPAPSPDASGEGEQQRKGWGVRFLAMFHMSNDSHLFRTRTELEGEGWRLEGNVFVPSPPAPLPRGGRGETPSSPNPFSHAAGEGEMPPSAGAYSHAAGEGEMPSSPGAYSHAAGEGEMPSSAGATSHAAGEGERLPAPSRELIERAREFRRQNTPAEALLWELLRNRQLLGRKFRRQHPIGQFIADFFCDDARLVIEIDGAVHREPSQQERDRLREEILRSHHLHVLRFTNQEVLQNTEQVLHQIAEFVVTHSYENPASPLIPSEDLRASLPLSTSDKEGKRTGEVYSRVSSSDKVGWERDETYSPLARSDEEDGKAVGFYSPLSNSVGEGGWGGEAYLPLYEAKMIWHYDHRFGTYEGVSDRNSTHLPTPDERQHADPNFVVQPWYWVSAKEVRARLGDWERRWLLGFRDVTNATNERTAIFSLLPWVGVGNKIPILLFGNVSPLLLNAFLANTSSIVFDFVSRQKLGGMTMNFFYVKQFPVLPPSTYTAADPSTGSGQVLRFIVPRVLELTYTAWDLQPFAEDVWNDADEDLREALVRQWEECPHSPALSPKALGERGLASGGEGCPFPPFTWNEARRAKIRAELDAYYARLYGLTRKQLRYILDPADLTPRELEDILDPWEEVDDPLDPQGYAERCARSDFPGETFRVLKEKELRQYGEYRTRRLVLEAWERLEKEGGVIKLLGFLTKVQVSHELIEDKLVEEQPSTQHEIQPAATYVTPANEPQTMLSDFGLYKCGTCGKMVMGFDRENHVRERHGELQVEWRKVR
ncbi:MAG: putative restriction /modification enzyme [Anaerolineae bacterium]|nr:MAG: putative restriction /modification enzyme [Anaerolineae bacterium]